MEQINLVFSNSFLPFSTLTHHAYVFRCNKFPAILQLNFSIPAVAVGIVSWSIQLSGLAAMCGFYDDDACSAGSTQRVLVMPPSRCRLRIAQHRHIECVKMREIRHIHNHISKILLDFCQVDHSLNTFLTISSIHSRKGINNSQWKVQTTEWIHWFWAGFSCCQQIANLYGRPKSVCWFCWL